MITGDELVRGITADHNGPFMAREILAHGLQVSRISVIGDDPTELMETIREARASADLVAISGGLGPTQDDLTRAAIAEAIARPLHTPPALPGHSTGALPEGAEQIPNPQGSAAGIWLADPDGCIVALPGVPWELTAMWPAVDVRIAATFGADPAWHCQTIRTVGLSEREVERRVLPTLAALPTPAVEHATRFGITAYPLAVDIHLGHATVAGVERAVARCHTALGDHVYGSGSTPLAAVAGHALAAGGHRVALAESCTGGGICAALTAIPGASGYVDEAVVSYSNRAKIARLGVPETMLTQHGAVSEPVGRAMAEGLLAHADADLALAVTGIAGPGGGTPDKPVGQVVVALADASGTFCRTFHHAGDRSRMILRTVNRALDLLRRYPDLGIRGLDQRFPPPDAR